MVTCEDGLLIGFRACLHGRMGAPGHGNAVGEQGEAGQLPEAPLEAGLTGKDVTHLVRVVIRAFHNQLALG